MHVFAALLAIVLAHPAKTEPLSLPSSYQRFVNDTATSVLLSYQQGDRKAIIQLINRDPLIVRKALINFLRQPDKIEAGRFLAGLFAQGCELELEEAFFDFFLTAAPDVRETVLDSVERITDAEYALEHVQRIDRFMDLVWARAIRQLHEAAAEFRTVGFGDGEAYSLARWTIYGKPIPDVQGIESRLETLEKALALYEKSSNLRGQAYCLVQLARLNYQALQERNKAAQLFLLASGKGKAESTPVLGYFIGQFNWLASKPPVNWLEESKTLLEKQPELRTKAYWMIWNQFDQYRAMLEQEGDPVLRIRARWDLFKALSEEDRQTEAVREADLAIDLAQNQEYDMSAYGGRFGPAVPTMLIQRAHSKIQLGMLREAESDCLDALRLIERKNSGAEANYFESLKLPALDRLSRIYRSLGEYPLAIERAREALKLSQQTDAGIDWGYRVLSEIHAEMGDLRAAEEYLESAGRMPDANFNPTPVWQAELHLNFQLYEEALRDLDRAEKGLEKMAKLRPAARRSNWWGTERLRILTEVLLRLGEPEKALATAKAMEARNHPVEQGMVGIALMALGRDSEAEKYFQTRLDSLKEAAWPQKEVDALLNLGKICQKQKRYSEANRYLQGALELYRQMGNPRGEMAVHLEMAESAHKQDDLRASDEHSRQALALASQLQDQQGIWSAQYRLARIALSQGQKLRAIEHFEAAVEAVETVSGNIKVDFFKMGFLEDKIQVFDELIALLGPTNPGQAFHYAERRRAQAFLESSQRAGLVTTNLRNDLKRRTEDQRARLVGKQRALLEQFSKPAGQRNTKLIQSLQNDLAQIREAHTQVIKEIELGSSAHSTGLTEVAPLTLKQVQQDVLRPGQSLLEYVVQDRETFLILVTKQSCKFLRLGIGRKQLAGQIEKLLLPFGRLREGQVDLLHVNYDVGLSHQLYELLFRPIESLVQPDTQIVIVPDDVLNYLPFESLSRSATVGSRQAGVSYSEYQNVDWLARRNIFSYALSATSLSLRRQQVRSAPRQLLAFGNPSVKGSQRNDVAKAVLRRASESMVEGPQLVALPQAARESQRIGEIMSGKIQSKVLVGHQATESAFSKHGPSADYVHFAVHSLINQEQPYYSALVLAPDQHSDGLFQTYEIVNTRLHSRLVTLSGCETALGKLKRGEGMLSLQRAFLQAGAESVVVTLWSVEDSTADFMEAFYRNIRNGQRLPVALRNAKLQYLEETLALGNGKRLSLSHPFFWAPFVLTTTSLQQR